MTNAHQSQIEKINGFFTDIYGVDSQKEWSEKFWNTIEKYKNHPLISQKRTERKHTPLFSEKDSALITYADTFFEPNKKPLHTLKKFLGKYVKDRFSILHILPFFPSSSDGGFAVKDFRQVDSKYGDWSDVTDLSKDYRIMADLVLNHISSQSEWFQLFLEGDKKYQNYFLHYDKKIDTSAVFRSRIHPLLTKFSTKKGDKYVWTTFSFDQIDLNYQNPEVLIEMIDILLFYLSHGIDIIRLDAVGFLWKDPKTSSIHLPKTHTIIKLLRSIIEFAAPYATLITETNVRYEENISYFGEKSDEAHAVYAFDLPPLVAHSFFKKNTSYLKNFYKSRDCGSGIFLNFLASHDGIGLLGAKNIVPDNEINELVEEVLCHREGFVSYKSIADENHPYELNVSFFDALNKIYEESAEANKKFLAAHAISFFLQGIPAVYIHSLLGSRNNYEEARRKGIKRLTNRAKISWDEIQENLAEPSSRRAQILMGICHLLEIRKTRPCFSPKNPQKLLSADPRLLFIERSCGSQKIVMIVNVSDETIEIDDYKNEYDLISEKKFAGRIRPYQTIILINII